MLFRSLLACAEALAGVEIRVEDFSKACDRAVEGDFVYLDPPYVPISRTASFTAYAKGGFQDQQQRRLADCFTALGKRGVKALLSNSMAPLVAELYRAHDLRIVMAARAVNRDAEGRGKVPEALVSNWKVAPQLNLLT